MDGVGEMGVVHVRSAFERVSMCRRKGFAMIEFDVWQLLLEESVRIV